jgi:hypothetical protein
LAAQRTSSLESLLLDGRSFANVQVPEGDLIHHHAGHAGEGDDGELSYLGRLPASVRRGTRQLIRYALLSPDGTTRRRACESLREAGVTREAVGVVAEVLLDAESPRWLQEIAAFVASYLNEESVAPILERVAADPSRDVSVRHAAFSALGDLGVRSRRTIDAAIAAAREPGSSEALLLRAATYVLAVLWLDEGDAGRTEAQLDALTRLYPAALQPDQVTRRLAGWGIENAAAISAATKSPQQVTIWGLGMPGPNSG